ncbi:MAG: hypothetical protein ABWK15_05365 [Dissulfuribacterales bacterium]
MKSLYSTTNKLVLLTIFNLFLYQQANAAFPHTPSGQLKNIFVPLQEREKAIVNEQAATVSIERLQKHFLLYGVISGPGGQTALLKVNPKETSDLPADLKDKPYIVLKKGEKLEDFTLTEVTSRSAVFKRGDKTVHFQLFEADDRPERSKSPVAQATPQAIPQQIPGIVQPPALAPTPVGAPAPMMAQNTGPASQSTTPQTQTATQQQPKPEEAKPAADSSTPNTQFGPTPIQPQQSGDLPHASAAPPPTADNPFLKALERARANQGSAPVGGAANPFMNLMKTN